MDAVTLLEWPVVHVRPVKQRPLVDTADKKQSVIHISIPRHLDTWTCTIGPHNLKNTPLPYAL